MSPEQFKFRFHIALDRAATTTATTDKTIHVGLSDAAELVVNGSRKVGNVRTAPTERRMPLAQAIANPALAEAAVVDVEEELDADFQVPGFQP